VSAAPGAEGEQPLARRIALTHDGTSFGCRVAAVIADGARVLLHRSEVDAFWSLPGGGVHVGERAACALRREMREELGAEIEVLRLLWLVEGFWDQNGTRQHEVGLYFLARLPAGSPVYERTVVDGVEGSLRLTFRWFPRERAVLAALPVLPRFLQRGLADLPAAPQHVVAEETGGGAPA
jgi:ADP-ribose pyrophosphatase YjhB (NUDIX family)